MTIDIKSTVMSVVASGVFMLSGCITNGRVEAPQVDASTTVDLSAYKNQYKACPIVTTDSVLNCNKQNGTLQKEGMMGCYTCVIDYADAGEDCQDTTDCKGECRVKQGEFLSTNTFNITGECSANNSPFGCYQTIRNGAPQAALCVD